MSTPTIKGASAIEASYAEGTMERWKSQCPHCGGYHEIRFQDIRYEYDEKLVAGRKTYKINSIYYLCPECGCMASEHDMKQQPARWEAENPDAYAAGCRSFWLNAFVSSWATWESIIRKYLSAHWQHSEAAGGLQHLLRRTVGGPGATSRTRIP